MFFFKCYYSYNSNGKIHHFIQTGYRLLNDPLEHELANIFFNLGVRYEKISIENNAVLSLNNDFFSLHKQPGKHYRNRISIQWYRILVHTIFEWQ